MMLIMRVIMRIVGDNSQSSWTLVRCLLSQQAALKLHSVRHSRSKYRSLRTSHQQVLLKAF